MTAILLQFIWHFIGIGPAPWTGTWKQNIFLLLATGNDDGTQTSFTRIAHDFSWSETHQSIISITIILATPQHSHNDRFFLDVWCFFFLSFRQFIFASYISLSFTRVRTRRCYCHATSERVYLQLHHAMKKWSKSIVTSCVWWRV